MKILLLNASLRKKNTYQLLQRVASHLDGHELDFCNINDYDIKACTGCENCMRNGTCIIKDEAHILLDKMIEADGIIIGTPIHLRQISGALKLLIDRACSWYHRSPIAGKAIYFVSTTQVTGSKEAMTYLRDLSVQWGTIYTGSLSRTLFSMDKEIKSSEFDRFIKYLDQNNRRYHRPSFKEIMEFNTQKVLAEQVLPLDKSYWEEKGYLDNPYFYKCKINPIKRLVGYSFYRLLSRIISKNKKE